MNTMGIKLISRLALGLIVSSIASYSTAQTVNFQDTFSRPDDTVLGQTEVGGFDYIESSPNGSQDDTALIFTNELYVTGYGGVSGTAPGLAIIDADVADVDISATLRFQGLQDPSVAATNNVAGFMLRRNGTATGAGFGPFLTGYGPFNEGQIEVTMGPGGGFFVREVNDGVLNTVYHANPFGGAATANSFSSPGQLPTTINGLPFDADGDGILEENEPFRLGANLVGNDLQIQINGATQLDLKVSRSVPINFHSNAAFYKNRFTSNSALVPFNPGYDDLVATGSTYTLAGPAPILHQGNTNPGSEEWFASNGAIGVISNGPVMDGATPAWNINDSSTNSSGSFSAWTRFLREDQVPTVEAEGWTMKADVKVLDASDSPDGSIELSVYPSSDLGFVLWLGSDASGNAIAAEFGGTLSGGLALGRQVTVNGAGYHEYEMVYDPISETVDVFADNNLILDNMLPVDREGSVLNRILWGSNSSSGTGNANYSSVEFIVGADTGLDGDFDNDGDVDGKDFLIWQRGGTSPPLDAGLLAAWQNNYGTPLVAAVGAVPEPATASLIGVSLFVLVTRRLRS